MAGIAGNTSSIHYALDEVITLHAVLVRRAVGKVGERGFAQLVLFQLPVILQMLAHVESDRPVVGLEGGRAGERTSL